MAQRVKKSEEKILTFGTWVAHLLLHLFFYGTVYYVVLLHMYDYFNREKSRNCCVGGQHKNWILAILSVHFLLNVVLSSDLVCQQYTYDIWCDQQFFWKIGQIYKKC